MELKFNPAAAEFITTLMLVTLPFLIGLCIHTKRRAADLQRKLAAEEREWESTLGETGSLNQSRDNRETAP